MGGGVRMVCFDWGGVLLRHCRSWREGCAAAGLEVRGDSESPAKAAVRRPLTQQYQIGAIGSEEFFERLKRGLDGLYTREELETLHDAWLLDEYPGVFELVSRLVRLPRVTTGLLSNTNERHWRRHLPRGPEPADYPTAGLLRHRHASHVLGLAKPGVEIFREFERQTGCRGAEILFFDDLAENTAAAQSLGWRVCMVDHTQETAGQIARGLESHGVLLPG